LRRFRAEQLTDFIAILAAMAPQKQNSVGTTAMQDMTSVEVKAYVPSKDFALSKRFYQDLGFDLVWSSEDLRIPPTWEFKLPLQNFYKKNTPTTS
jgi:hypothetical protein